MNPTQTPPPVVRTALAPSEIEKARELTNRSWMDTYSALIGEEETRKLIEEQHTSERFSADAKSNDGIFLVGMDPLGNIVGHLYAEPRDDELFIERFHVDPDKRGEGIGEHLLNSLRDRAAAEDYRQIWLVVTEGNDRAVQFYEKLGFSRSSREVSEGGLAGKPAHAYELVLAQ